MDYGWIARPVGLTSAEAGAVLAGVRFPGFLAAQLSLGVRPLRAFRQRSDRYPTDTFRVTSTLRVALTLLIFGCAKPGLRDRTCVQLHHSRQQDVLPDFLVFAPGADSGRAGVAASDAKAPSPNSAFGGIHVWHLRRDTVVLDFDGERTSTQYRLLGLPDSGRGVAIMAIHLSFSDSMGGGGFAHTDTTPVTVERVDCARLPHGPPSGV